jgi:hypothetical protein
VGSPHFGRVFAKNADTKSKKRAEVDISACSLPFIPENRHGDTLALAVVHWAGPMEEAKKALQPFWDVAPIVADGTGPLPYPALNGAFDALYPKGIRAYWKGAFVKELPEAAIAAQVEYGSRVPEVSATMHMHPINGACHRVGPNETAFAYRDATYAMVFLAAWTDPEKDAERIGWVRDYYQAMAPYSEPGGYIPQAFNTEQLRNRCEKGWWIGRSPEVARVFFLNIEEAAFVNWDYHHEEMILRSWSPERGLSAASSCSRGMSPIAVVGRPPPNPTSMGSRSLLQSNPAGQRTVILQV